MNIFSLDGGVYRMLDRAINFLFLNVIWLLFCLPIITIFPATAAMFGVVREWNQKKNQGVFRTFFMLFKETFLKSFLFGIVWFILAYLFYFNISISLQMSGSLKLIILSILICLCLLFTLASIYLFPLMVHYKMQWVALIKNAILFSVSQLKTTILCAIIILIAMFINYVMPIGIVFVWSVAAYNIYRFCDKSFKKIELMGGSS